MLFRLNAHGQEAVKTFLNANYRDKPTAKMLDKWFVSAEASFNTSKMYLPDEAIPNACIVLSSKYSHHGRPVVMMLASKYFVQVS